MAPTTANPMAEVESLLANPGASGIFLTAVVDGSPIAAHGAEVGDIITTVGGESIEDLRGFLMAMQPQPEGETTRELDVRKGDGTDVTWTVEVPLKGYSHCVVKEGECAWEDIPDSDYEPDFSALADGVEIWLRNSFGDDRAGFERVLVAHDGDLLRLKTLFRIGDDDAEYGKWDYRTRGRSAHRFDRSMSTVETAFWEGSPGEEVLTGDVVLGDDGHWRGKHGEKDVAIPAPADTGITPYTIMVLPLTMPLEEGASLTVNMCGEGTGFVTCRGRLRNCGREDVSVDGVTVSAWCFRQFHYGVYEEEERFYVSDDRRLVRVDWGPGYNNCTAELVDADHVLDGVAPHITVE